MEKFFNWLGREVRWFVIVFGGIALGFGISYAIWYIFDLTTDEAKALTALVIIGVCWWYADEFARESLS